MKGLKASERGYAMAALLVALSVMAIMLGAALPSWRTYVQREKEAELVFRGEQYARAIRLFQQRYANASPPNIDVLVNERFLRKKYKDPITGDDFQIVTAGSAPPGAQPGASQARSPIGPLSEFEKARLQADAARQAVSGAAGRAGGAGLGIIGVTSKSPLKSFRLYRGRDTYNQFVFAEVQQSTRAGGAGGRAGQRGTGPGQDGRGGADGRGGVDGRGGRGGQQPPGGLQQVPGGRGTQPQQPPPGRGFPGRNFPN
jgi:type II secretory pathway pseudopilin PulG